MSLLLERKDISSISVHFADGTEMLVTEGDNFILREWVHHEDKKPSRLHWEISWTEE